MDNTASVLNENQMIREIHKHQCIESKKRGYDVGFEEAAEDWIVRHAEDWIKYQLPKRMERRPVKRFQKRRFIYP